MKETIFIPKKIKVGFNEREDTYTKKLGYVIYHDGKAWRKEKSWDSWRLHIMDSQEYETKKQAAYNEQIKRQKEYFISYQNSARTNPGHYWDRYAKMTEEEYLAESVGSYKKFRPYLGNVTGDKSCAPVEYNNEPLEGFVLNKKAGGYAVGWDHRQTYCRVYDPRGFEFEITIPNLLYILENTNSIKGKGLDGKFIYGWDGKDLVLVPEEAPEYKRMVEYTTNLSLKVAKKDLKVGGVYTNNIGANLVYLGNFNYYDYNEINSGKRLWFYDLKHKTYTTYTLKTIKKYVEDVDNLADLLDGLEKNKNYKPKHPSVYEYTPIVIEPKNLNDVYIKTKSGYSNVAVYKYTNAGYFHRQTVTYQLYHPINKVFGSFADLILAYPLYKKTKINEKI